MKQRLTLCALALVFALEGPVPSSAFSLEQPDVALPGSGTAPPGVTSWDLLGKASVRFTEEDGAEKVATVVPPEVEALDGRQVKLAGFGRGRAADAPVLLVEYPADCPFCLAAGTEPSRIVEVDAADGVDWHDDQVVVSGRLEVVHGDADGLVYRLHEARGVSRRGPPRASPDDEAGARDQVEGDGNPWRVAVRECYTIT